MNQNRILIVLLAFCAVLIMPLSAQAKQAGPMADHSKVMTPAGEYVVYVFKGGEWKEAGVLSFNKFFHAETIDLSKFIAGHGNVKIRLVEKGGGAAHIDAVLLGDSAPVDVKGLHDILALKKLGKKDFDVVDAFKKSIEVTFLGGQSKVMSLTARVEGTRLSEVPFQFPLSNLYKKMTDSSEFYRYSLMTGQAPGKDDRVDMSRKPFFKAYSVTGTGHPSGYTYGWVQNDDKNLYVTIDFTPDDTMDGAKDYSKVYVKTREGLKDFKVSVPETKWGSPEFTYTDKVAYQHKVYDFKIPLKELGLKDAKKKDELQLAFAAYGTAGPTSCSGSDACTKNTGTFGIGSCNGDHACYQNTGNIGDYSCNGPYVCYRNSGDVGDQSCNSGGSYGTSCYQNSAHIGDKSCNDVLSCYASSGTIGDDSCEDYASCYRSGGIIGNDSCTKSDSCHKSNGIIGDNSCTFAHACEYFQGTCGYYSCTAEYSCNRSDAIIGDVSCAGSHSCERFGGSCGNGSCTAQYSCYRSDGTFGDDACTAEPYVCAY